MATKTIPLIDRVMALISPEPNTGCWLWMGYNEKNGYSAIKLKGKKLKVHRIVYEHFVGPIPDGMEIDHLCRVTCCVNPNHLEPVTHTENVRRANAAQTHCKRGHKFTQDNTYIAIWSDGYKCRQCRTCCRQRKFAVHHGLPFR